MVVLYQSCKFDSCKFDLNSTIETFLSHGSIKHTIRGIGTKEWLVLWKISVRRQPDQSDSHSVILEFEPHNKAIVVSLSMKLYHHCLALVGSRNGFERDFTIELKSMVGPIMLDCHLCQISAHVKYRQNTASMIRVVLL